MLPKPQAPTAVGRDVGLEKSRLTGTGRRWAVALSLSLGKDRMLCPSYTGREGFLAQIYQFLGADLPILI